MAYRPPCLAHSQGGAAGLLAQHGAKLQEVGVCHDLWGGGGATEWQQLSKCRVPGVRMENAVPVTNAPCLFARKCKLMSLQKIQTRLLYTASQHM